MHHPFVPLRLAGDAGADAPEGRPPPLGDRLTTIIAVRRALTRWCQCTSTQNRIGDRIVDLVLNGAVARPSARHELLLSIANNARGALGLLRGNIIRVKSAARYR